MDEENILSDNEYELVVKRDQSALLTYSIILFFMGTLILISFIPAVVALMPWLKTLRVLLYLMNLAVVYMTVRGFIQPEVLIKANEDGMFIFSDNKEKHIVWSEISSVASIRDRKVLIPVTSGTLMLILKKGKRIDVAWLANVEAVERKVNELLEKYNLEIDKDETEN